jgi:hypothetical protein
LVKKGEMIFSFYFLNKKKGPKKRKEKKRKEEIKTQENRRCTIGT